MMEVIEFQKENKYIEDFIKLPKELYESKKLMQNEAEERQLLEGAHVLSKYFTLHKFLVYKEAKAVGRYVITTYEDDDTAYIGFFECIDEMSVADMIFKEAKHFSLKRGYKKIIGPVDASFWIKYRIKINNFDKLPYTGEPYNKEYYYKMFLSNGFFEHKKYISNSYNHVPLDKMSIAEFKKRYMEFKERGYIFESPNKKNYDECIKSIYGMIIELYNDFPAYKYIEEEDFIKQFSYFKYIIDYSFVKLVYKENKPVAFFIGIPDYKNLFYKKLNILDYIKVIWKKNVRSSNYVMLYMGVDKEHLGLGRAVTYTIIKNLKKRNSSSIGALIKDSNINRNYVKDEINSKYEYVLLECDLG